jgi:MoaA/NifB/PqqE/SkfB family radical SAM enzyme
MNIVERMEKVAKEALVKTGVQLLSKDPEKNVDKLFDITKKAVKDPDNLRRIEFVEEYYHNNTATYEYIQNILKTTDKKCIQKLFANFFANATWFAMPKREKVFVEEDVKIPFVILLSPSMRCNLRCMGCYAGNYNKEDDIPYEEVDRIVKEARELGIYYFVILGGEPFFNEYMLDIYEKYNDVMFTPFTNGTLFDEKLADRIQKLGNVMPMFSLEGFEKETDARRGKGVFQKVMHGMDLLRERGVLFGVSTATGRFNIDTVVSDEFIDMLIEKGAKMSWYFIFMPVGTAPDVNLMLTPDQRIFLGRRSREIRTTKPYFIIDFFNDAPYVGGCIAGKYYCHINSNEDVEPCIFSHLSTYNLKGKSLKDAFKEPFFKELRARQPYNKNMLRPCMMIDNPNVVREVTAKVHAKPTDEGAKLMIENVEFQKQLDKLAEEFAPVAEKAWKEDFNECGNTNMAKG